VDGLNGGRQEKRGKGKEMCLAIDRQQNRMKTYMRRKLSDCFPIFFYYLLFGSSLQLKKNEKLVN